MTNPSDSFSIKSGRSKPPARILSKVIPKTAKLIPVQEKAPGDPPVMISKFLSAEISEQPDVIDNLIAKEKEHASQIAGNLRGKFRYVIIAARGTSDNAARYAQYLFGAHNRLQVALATPSLISIYSAPPDLSEALVIGVSQSGQSPDIVSVIAEGKKQGCPTLAITNETNSPLALAAEHTLALHAGPEKATAATKTYTTSLTALALLSCALEENPKRLDSLIEVPRYMRETIAKTSEVLPRIDRYRYMEHCVVLSRGYNYCTAFEIALKVKELTHVIAEPFSSADFRHGPIATVHKGFPVILIAPHGVIYPDLLDLAGEIQSLGAETIIVSDDPDLLSTANLPLPIPPGLPEWLTPLVTVVPGQILSMQLAIEKGLNPDQPSGITKVTETL